MANRRTYRPAARSKMYISLATSLYCSPAVNKLCCKASAWTATAT